MVQPTHSPPGTLTSQVGVLPEHPRDAVHTEHTPFPLSPAVSHTGVAPPQPLSFARQCRQTWAVESHSVRFASKVHCVSERHCTHCPRPPFPVVLHTGVVPLHPELSERHVLHTCADASHTPEAQSAVALHATHRPPATDVSHAGVDALQPGATAPTAAGRHVTQAPLPPFAAVLQTGVAPEHPIPPPRHVLQTFAVVSQTPDAQSDDARHPTHWPPATEVSQTVPAPQPAVAVHVTQVCELVSHAGVAPEQFAFEVHATHRPPATVMSQTGVAEPAAHPWVRVQVTHAPAPPPAERSQTGVVPLQPSVAVQVLQARAS